MQRVWTWANTAFFTGYRSLLCGRLDGHTAAPLASEVDAVGGLLPKVGVYAGLWGYAQEQSLVRTEAVWQANRGAHWFSDYSAAQFRVPDLRDMFAASRGQTSTLQMREPWEADRSIGSEPHSQHQVLEQRDAVGCQSSRA